MIISNGLDIMTSYNSHKKELLIIGAGAIGGVTGAMLQASGKVDVCLVDTNMDIVEGIRRNGVRILNHPTEGIRVPIKRSINEIEKKYQNIFVSVKNPYLENVMKELPDKLTTNGLVYSMQNGMGNTEIMAKYLSKEQIVPAVISWGAYNLGGGKYKLTSSTGDFVIGFENGGQVNDPRLLEMKEILSMWKPVKITSDIIGHRWSKLIVNSVIASFGGIFGLTVRELLKNKSITPLMGALKNEGIQVAKALGITLKKIDGFNIKYFFYRSALNDGLIKSWYYRLASSILLRLGARRHGAILSTIYHDLRKGVKTEVDYLNGHIARKGKKLNLQTPINSFMVKAVHEIEEGKRKIGLENLPELKKVGKKSREIIRIQEKKLLRNH
jgi:2-dehydropantoate 2-reductase